MLLFLFIIIGYCILQSEQQPRQWCVAVCKHRDGRRGRCRNTIALLIDRFFYLLFSTQTCDSSKRKLFVLSIVSILCLYRIGSYIWCDTRPIDVNFLLERHCFFFSLHTLIGLPVNMVGFVEWNFASCDKYSKFSRQDTWYRTRCERRHLASSGSLIVILFVMC